MKKNSEIWVSYGFATNPKKDIKWNFDDFKDAYYDLLFERDKMAAKYPGLIFTDPYINLGETTVRVGMRVYEEDVE